MTARSAIAYSIAPLLSVRNGARAVEFYKSAFGAITGRSVIHWRRRVLAPLIVVLAALSDTAHARA